MFNLLRTAGRVRAVAPVTRRHYHASLYNQARILVSDPIDQICIDTFKNRGHQVDVRPELAKDKEAMIAEIPKYEGLVVRSGTKVTADIINAASKMRYIGRAGTGVDNIDVKAATKRGILVMNTPGGNTTSAAELTMSMILAVSRNIPAACNSLKEGRWDRKGYMGTELNGKTVGLVGLGRIGREVARWCQAFGMTTIAFDPVVSPEVAKAANIETVSLDDVYARSDFITVHCPLTSETKDLINSETLAKCKDGVKLINCARGGIISEQDLLPALESGKVGGVALDVFDQEPPPADLAPLLQHPLVICTPHLGASTEEAQEKVAREIASQIADGFDNKPVTGVVNAPFVNLLSKRELKPYVALAERLGSLQAQLLAKTGEPIKRLSIVTQGSLLKDCTDVMKAATLKGFFQHLLEPPVNLINSPELADENGLLITEQRQNDIDSRYNHIVTVVCESGDTTKSISGVVFGNDSLRLIRMDDFEIEVEPQGHMLFFHNQDKPGVLANITGTLAEDGINIANFNLGRDPGSHQALGIVSTDNEVHDAALAKLRGVANMIDMTRVELEEDDTFKDDADDMTPKTKPTDPNFGSGPCKKRPGYKLENLYGAPLGRSHRSSLGKSKLKQAIEESKRILEVPDDYLLGIVPGSDTGAFEMAMWSMLGSRPVDVCHWESFGKGWKGDIMSELSLSQVNEFTAPYGELPDLDKTNPDHDIVFTWNGTTSGVMVPNGDWISNSRKGLTLCDATSAAFGMEMPWSKLDVTTYSWQKVLGGEAAHGVIILSPRAVERLETVESKIPLPKLFRLTKGGKLNKDIFDGSVINTPSMLCVEDYLDALQWARDQGGVKALVARSQANLAVVEEFVHANPWIDFLAKDKSIRSNTSVCLTMDLEPQQIKKLVTLLGDHKVAYDIGSYRDAPPGLRIWCGATVETHDVQSLMPWLKWAYNAVRE
eukprot:GFYU01028415.1.p1 GENE.GFYU01028415.1~~GFYU01028415.1.p1  ORF type:complete len:946 (+),score=338.36 GFYU01028415.1:80-2917(+)